MKPENPPARGGAEGAAPAGGLALPEPLLAKIEGGTPLSSFTLAELTEVCAEIRRVIIRTVGRNGGHLSPNLGVVELTAALHYVFNLPRDKIVWDVGHQCYAHKLLTGRYTDFSTLRTEGGLAGFPRMNESPCDAFNTGHASTSISAALGLLAGEALAAAAGGLAAAGGTAAAADGGLAGAGAGSDGAAGGVVAAAARATAERAELGRFIDEALAGRQTPHKRIKTGALSETAQNRVEALTGVKPKWINIDNNGIVHALGQKHHNLEKEDILYSVETLNTAAGITVSEKKHLKNEVLIFKNDRDGEITFLAELHAKNKYLMIFNGWRLKKARCRRSPNATLMSPGADVQNGSPHTDAYGIIIGASAKNSKRGAAAAATDTAPARPSPKPPSVVAVIGDGALTGGLAYEALSCAPHLGLPLVIVLNDNRMSISPNVGGLSRHLSRLSMRTRYQTFRTAFDSMTLKIPFIGKPVFNLVQRLKRAVKAVFYQDNFFVELGFEYVGPIDGHNLKELTETFADVLEQTTGTRRLPRPVVVHVVTKKGKGYPPAEAEPDIFHGVPPFSPAEGVVPPGGESWTRVFGEALIEAARRDNRICAITAAMEKGAGLGAFHAEFPARFFDVGIAEAHAVTFAAALAARGLRPVAAIYSTFLQRAVDSVLHDTALAALPVLFAVDRAGFVGGDGETHQGLFDISILRSVPGLVIMEPAFAEELPLMLNWALAQNRPCAIRYPKAAPPESAGRLPPLVEGRGALLSPPASSAEAGPPADDAATVLLAFTGSLYTEALNAARILAGEGTRCALYNFRFISPVDEAYLLGLLRKYPTVIVAEEGAQSGGLGEYVSALALRKGGNCRRHSRVVTLNAGNAYYAQGTRPQLLRRAGLNAESIAAAIRSGGVSLG